MSRNALLSALCIVLPGGGLPVLAAAGDGTGAGQTGAGAYEITQVADGFDVPWGFDFLPDGSVLVTERGGRLWHVDEKGERQEVEGLPEVYARGQGGLLDVMVPQDFDESREVFFTYARGTGDGAATALGVGRLSDATDRLEDVERIFEAVHPGSGSNHFGSRVVEAPDGRLFVTLGERQNADEAQSLASHNGTVVRLERDGSVPEDNPFVDDADALPGIWSYGHRNPQGAAIDDEGQLWVVEHGARGGDEINRIEKGANYGWPVISYGTGYDGSRIGEGTEKAGMEQPAFYWDPSIAPSDMMIYSGRLWPEWEGQFLVGALKFDLISRLGGDPLEEIERIKTPETLRIRDIAEAEDGSIWFLSEDNGALYRMAPE
ncbi:PQQ-dependent sugar dehydrogenase [Pontibaca methylaminivorans]|uniref:PQQ-dependent sugar dehydrogenase n=1 Tax=Pontibaca methylaminivorans TaxID=515897 RepID=UPI002FDA0250